MIKSLYPTKAISASQTVQKVKHLKQEDNPLSKPTKAIKKGSKLQQSNNLMKHFKQTMIKCKNVTWGPDSPVAETPLESQLKVE